MGVCGNACTMFVAANHEFPNMKTSYDKTTQGKMMVRLSVAAVLKEFYELGCLGWWFYIFVIATETISHGIGLRVGAWRTQFLYSRNTIVHPSRCCSPVWETLNRHSVAHVKYRISNRTMFWHDITLQCTFANKYTRCTLRSKTVLRLSLLLVALFFTFLAYSSCFNQQCASTIMSSDVVF